MRQEFILNHRSDLIGEFGGKVVNDIVDFSCHSEREVQELIPLGNEGARRAVARS